MGSQSIVKKNNYSKDALVKEKFGITIREELTVIDYEFFLVVDN